METDTYRSELLHGAEDTESLSDAGQSLTKQSVFK